MTLHLDFKCVAATSNDHQWLGISLAREAPNKSQNMGGVGVDNAP